MAGVRHARAGQAAQAVKPHLFAVLPWDQHTGRGGGSLRSRRTNSACFEVIRAQAALLSLQKHWQACRRFTSLIQAVRGGRLAAHLCLRRPRALGWHSTPGAVRVPQGHSLPEH